MSLKLSVSKTIRPGDDFYRFVNEEWIATHPIPAEKSHVGALSTISDDNFDRLKVLLESEVGPHDTEAVRKVKSFYKTAMDVEAIETAGLTPIQPILDQIEAINGGHDFWEFMTSWHSRGMELVWHLYLDVDDKDSSTYVMRISQSGLGLPDRDYYFNESKDFVKVREQYQVFLANLFTLLGDLNADESAAGVYELEKSLAEQSDTALERRDVIANYNVYDLKKLKHDFPSFEWEYYLDALGVAKEKTVLLTQPEFVKTAIELFENTDASVLRSYSLLHCLLYFMPALPKAYDKLHFDFYGTVLSGSEKQETRYRRIVNTCMGVLPEPTGEIFIESYFDEKAKATIYELVDHIKDALRTRIAKLDWMTEQTKQKAFKKLDTFLPLLGYPDTWRSVTSLEISDSYVMNLLAVRSYDWQFDMDRLTKPVNRKEWLMSPALVNAYYWPNTNGITFPAGILQPPLFDANGDFAANYGGIGVVIGHELTHGFDDKGALFDEHGKLQSWWTDDDWKAFSRKTKRLARQFSHYELEGQHLNGELTLGENIADLAGTLIAYDALQKKIELTASRELLDGFTPEQRFFMAFARTWRENMRPELAQHLLVTNPHSPAYFRVIGTLPNVDAFYEAFLIKVGDALYIEPKDRVRIW
jgi:putative endopeptidase